VLLGIVARCFSLRTLRFVTAVTALALTALVTQYGLTHPTKTKTSSDLASSFTQGADQLSEAFFHPLRLGHQVPAPGRIGWLVIIVLLAIGYRVLEAWAMHREAPSLDTSTLGDSQPDDAASKTADGVTNSQRRDQLVAQLKFRLSAIEVRAPAILPGGSRSNGLATIAEASGVAGSGLAGAIIRFFGMLWPHPRRFQVRVRVESSPGEPQDTGDMKVTVGLEDPGTGESVANKTIVSANLDRAAAVVAGYVARHIFVRDPTTPPWCVGAPNGRDLAAILLAKQERVYAKSSEDIEDARDRQIKILEEAAGNSQCAGIVRYELAQLYNLKERHMAALRLHAINREQHPRFYRGRYRLSMSLEMIAGETFQLKDTAEATDLLEESLHILRRCGVIGDVEPQHKSIVDGKLQPVLRKELLEAAGKELRAIRRQLTLGHVIWGTFCHRDERVIRVPHWGLRQRQSFHDGLCVAELLVALRMRAVLQELSKDQELSEAERSAASEILRRMNKIPHRMNLALRVVAAIACDNDLFKQKLTGAEPQDVPESPAQVWPPAEKRDRTRWLPWQPRTPSWEAAYNTACAYAALDLDPKFLVYLGLKVVTSLERAINNPDCEMQRPSDWISHDPDFLWLQSSSSKEFENFLDAQKKKDYLVTATRRPVNADGQENGAVHDMPRDSPEAVSASGQL
jgi:hypothetical protein